MNLVLVAFGASGWIAFMIALVHIAKRRIDLAMGCDIILRLIVFAGLVHSEHAYVGSAYRHIRLMRMSGVGIDVPEQVAPYVSISSDGGNA